MAAPLDPAGYGNTSRPPPGATYRQDASGTIVNPYTLNQVGRQNRYPQGDIRSGRPRLGRDARGRVGVYGSANPYQNSTNQGTLTWLGTGFPHPLPEVPPGIPPAPSFQPIQPGGARPSWDLAGIGALLGPYYHVPIREDYNLNVKLREAIPLIDAAILRMKDLVGFPSIEAAPRLKADIEDFLDNLPVNRIQRGAKTWAKSHLDNAYTFGRAHAEVILTASRKDVFGLVEVHPTTTGLRPTFDGYVVNVVQYQHGGGVPITLAPELLLTSVHDFRGDDPNGTSLIASLPFVAEILIKMFRSMGQTWERFGTPNYHINWEPPDDWQDPTGHQTAEILQPMMQNLYASDLDRANGKIRHFWTTGKVGLSVMGADGQTLEFESSARKFAEEITSKTGIPPFMLGLSWSTTERMSTSQARLLTEVINAGRVLIEGPLTQLITLRQKLVGRTGRFALKWDTVSLIDLVDNARAAWMEAQAEQLRIGNGKEKVRLGVMSMPELAKSLRDDLDDVPPNKIPGILDGEDGLPKLPEELPEDPELAIQAAKIGQPGPARGQTGRPIHGPMESGAPEAENTRRPQTNGNGNGRR